MRQSELFTKTRKETPKDETAKNAELLIKAGFIHKEMAGVYAFLPLGLRVLEKIKHIVREEMDALGGQELLMTSIQRKELWEKTDRWDDKKVDIWFKSKLKSGGEIGFAWSHEEEVTEMMKNYVRSFRDLPALPYQFQTKLRNETRAKSGIMRGREFLMEDLYSFAKDEKEHEKIYTDLKDAYMRIFQKVGLGDRTFCTFASGGAFTEFSHEFQTVCDAGEDTIYIDRSKNIAINKEILTDAVLKKFSLNRADLEEVKAAEVGNIFSFGTKKSEALGLSYIDLNGSTAPVVLGSYGIGITRLMGVIAEIFSDDRGLVWPEAMAPFQIHLLDLGAKKEADALYEKLGEMGAEVFYDDREKSAGEKLADADLIGIPLRLVVSKKTIIEKKVELKKRSGDDAMLVSESELQEILEKK